MNAERSGTEDGEQKVMGGSQSGHPLAMWGPVQLATLRGIPPPPLYQQEPANLRVFVQFKNSPKLLAHLTAWG